MRARPKDLKAQVEMFKNMIEWRKENNVETILKDYTPDKLLWRYYPGAMLKGYDKEGDPVYLERLGVTVRGLKVEGNDKAQSGPENSSARKVDT